MKRIVVQAKPHMVAIVGALPITLAIASLPFTNDHPALFPAAVYLGVALLLGWYWIVGDALNARISRSRRPPIGRFRLSVLFCSAYITYFLMSTLGGGAPLLTRSPALFFVLHLMAMGAMLHVLYFVGKNLSLAEADIAGAVDTSWSTALGLSSIAGIIPVQRRVNTIFEDS